MDRGYNRGWSLGLGSSDGLSSSSSRGLNGNSTSRARDGSYMRGPNADGPNGSMMAGKGRDGTLGRSKAMNANAGNIVLGPGNNVLKGLGAGSNGGAAVPAPPPPKKNYLHHQPPASGVNRSNRSVSFSPAPAPAQAWPVLNSSTLGTFQQAPPPTPVTPMGE